jgi:hypothetical protein
MTKSAASLVNRSKVVFSKSEEFFLLLDRCHLESKRILHQSLFKSFLFSFSILPSETLV